VNTDDLVARIAELERRLEVAEDDRAIRQLLARYGFNADTVGRGAAYVSLYTEDGAIDASNTQRWEGHAALMDFITNPQVHGRMWVGVCTRWAITWLPTSMETAPSLRAIPLCCYESRTAFTSSHATPTGGLS
jgi:hypothetical protein